MWFGRIRSILFCVMSILSFMLILLWVTLWIRHDSGYYIDSLGWDSKSDPESMHTYIYFNANPGYLHIDIERSFNNGQWKPGWELKFQSDPSRSQYIDFGPWYQPVRTTYINAPRTDPDDTTHPYIARYISVKYWLLILVSLILPGSWCINVWRKRTRFPAGCCHHCGYDLRATPDRCPECGTVVAVKMDRGS